MNPDKNDHATNTDSEYLCEVQYMTADSEGYIYFKGQLVEHFDLPAHSKTLLKSKLRSVQKACFSMENLGLPINITNYLDQNLWEHIKEPYDPFLFFIDQFKSLYVKDRSVMFYYFETDLGQTTRYKYKTINMDTGAISLDKVQIPYYFHEFAESEGYEQVSVSGDSYERFLQWRHWIEISQFKPWYLNYKAYLDFSRQAVNHGHIIEVPQSFFEQDKTRYEVLTEAYEYQACQWYVIQDKSSEDDTHKFFRAFRKEGRRCFTATIPIPKTSLLLKNQS